MIFHKKRHIALYGAVLAMLVFVCGCGKKEKTASDTPEYLYAAAGCAECHSLTSGDDDSGKIPLNTEALTEAQFASALRQGKLPDGSDMGDIMPWKYYARITDGDTVKLYEYYMKTAFPGEKISVGGALPAASPFKEDTSKTPQYNRGMYLVEALGRCGACHSPEEGGKPLSGGVYETEWTAYNITSDPAAGIGKWSSEDIEKYLKDGVVPGKGNAISGMGLFVEVSSGLLSDSDRKAVAVYLKSAAPYGGGEEKARFEWGEPYDGVNSLRKAMVRLDKPEDKDGAVLYNGYCASCHGFTGEGNDSAAVGGFPSLTHNSTVGASEPNNLIMVILNGTERTYGGKTAFMPAFSGELDDGEIAAIASFVTGRFGNPAVKITPADVKKFR